MSAPLLDYRNVTVYRGDRIGLDNISLRVDQGEHVAILGPNGSGKSTLIKTFTRECYPAPLEEDVSWLRIMGQDTWDVTSLRSMLGIVTNDLVTACTHGMSSDFVENHRRVTGRHTVLSGFFSSIGLWSHHQVTPEMQRKTDEILARFDVSHLADRSLDAVSSGEARRLVIGRALVHDPAALVLDEVANSLDMGASRELRDIVRRVAQTGTTVVMVTHHLSDIIPEIDRVIFLSHGRIVDDGRKAAVLTDEKLSRLFGVPVEVTERDGYWDAK
jgi:iron complex transport system ATP-binding protein